MIDARISGTQKELADVIAFLVSTKCFDGISKFYRNRGSDSTGRIYFKIDVDKIRAYLSKKWSSNL